MTRRGRAPRNLAAEHAAVFVDALARAGVTDVVISPGSRSTPYVIAAATHPDLRCHDVIDERVAAFFALGLARATARPPALLCTSGTAGAHYYPAVIEASAAFLPLVIVTADRPSELQGCAAPQTIDQTRLYGEHARASIDLGDPEGSDDALRAVRRKASQAVARARHPVPGPVHVNAPARKPLEPPADADLDADERDLSARAAALRASPLPASPASIAYADPAALDAIADNLRRARRAVIVAGPIHRASERTRAAIFALGARARIPILCEAASGLRFAPELRDAFRAHGESLVLVDAFDAILRQPELRLSFEADLVLQIGAPPTSSAWERLIAERPLLARHVVTEHGHADPQSSARSVVAAPIAAALEGLAARLTRRDEIDAAFSAALRADNARAWSAIGRVLEDRSAGVLGEGAAVRAAVRSARPGSALVIGNSLPIREVDTFCPAGSAACEVFVQRGANGIDGLVSGAAGVARSGQPTTLLLGDVSFLHDVSGLAVARGLAAPLVIVVIDNDGGRIFATLPVAGIAGVDLAHWLTPPRVALDGLARAFGHPVEVCDALPALERALASAQARAGCSVVIARVPPDDAADAYRAIDERIAARSRPEPVGRGGS